MTDEVRDSYDLMAKEYAQLFLGDLDRDANARQWLEAFAELAATKNGEVADLGCGPGHVVNYLSNLGLAVTGYDLSSGQIAEAQQAFPELKFGVGDLAALDDVDASLGGIVSRYSIIHMNPERLDLVFAEWMRVLEPGAPVLLSFYGSLHPDGHGMPFNHAVVTAYELFPATIADLLQVAGFTDIEVGCCDPPEGGRPFDQATVLAQKNRSLKSPATE